MNGDLEFLDRQFPRNLVRSKRSDQALRITGKIDAACRVVRMDVSRDKLELGNLKQMGNLPSMHLKISNEVCVVIRREAHRRTSTCRRMAFTICCTCAPQLMHPMKVISNLL